MPDNNLEEQYQYELEADRIRYQKMVNSDKEEQKQVQTKNKTMFGESTIRRESITPEGMAEKEQYEQLQKEQAKRGIYVRDQKFEPTAEERLAYLSKKEEWRKAGVVYRERKKETPEESRLFWETNQIGQSSREANEKATQYQMQLERERVELRRLQQGSQEQEEQEQPKMGWGIFLSVLFLSLVADILEISLIGAPLIIIIDIILGFMLGFSKGAKKQWKKWIAGFLPIPLVRVALLIWSFISSRSTTLQQIGKLASANAK